MNFDNKYFTKFNFSDTEIRRNLENAVKDVGIAQKDTILEVKFSYAYTAFIKSGLALLSFYKIKVKSVPGHHVKIIEQISRILKDEAVVEMGDVMRSKRNLDFYGGGVEVSEKEVKEYISFVESVLSRIKKIINQ